MKPEQLEILHWWYGKRDYTTGTLLYSKYGHNKTLLVTFTKPGKENVMSAKLHYELCKAVGLNWNAMPALPKVVDLLNAAPAGVSKVVMADISDIIPFPIQKPNSKGEESKTKPVELPAAPYDPGKYIPIVSEVKLLQYPKVVRQLKMEYQENYQTRSILHKQMREVPENNAPEHVSKRAILLKHIHNASARMEFLYRVIEKYEKNKVVPLEEEIWPPEKKTDLPDSIDELKKLKKNLQTNNTKDRNKLLYQKKTKGSKANPMPDGPMRTRIEFRIKKNEKQILAIDNKIVELENVD